MTTDAAYVRRLEILWCISTIGACGGCFAALRDYSDPPEESFLRSTVGIAIAMGLGFGLLGIKSPFCVGFCLALSFWGGQFLELAQVPQLGDTCKAFVISLATINFSPLVLLASLAIAAHCRSKLYPHSWSRFGATLWQV